MFLFRTASIKDLDLKLPFDEIRKRARIVVIDDDQTAFPYELLQKEGYNITYWPKVDRLRDLESGEYDLIILDIAGVAEQSVSATDGKGVLEHLKRINPAQLIIAYSGKMYDLAQADFWRLADDSLGKPSDLITCKKKIDYLLKEHFTPMRYWLEVERVLRSSGISDKELKKLDGKVSKSLKTGSKMPIEIVQSYASIGASSAVIVNNLLQIIARFSS